MEASPGIARAAWALVALAALALAGASCAGDPEAEAPAGTPDREPAAEVPEPVTEGEAYALPLEDLRARTEALVAGLPVRPEDDAAIERARRTAGMLRVLALRTPGPAPAEIERARALLAAAADAGVTAASCRAHADRIALEAVDVGDRARAATLAREGAQRFGAAGGAAACAGRFADAARALAGATRGPAPAGEAVLSRIVVYGADARPARSVRVLFELDRPVEPESVERPATDAAPRRLWLDFPGTQPAADVPAELAVNAGGLVAVRREDVAGAATRVELELDPRATVRRYALRDPYRLVVDLALPEGATEPVPGAAAAGVRPVRRIVLDPGHGGDEWGASSGGVRESHLVFDIARRAAAALAERLPGVEVLLTRDDDVLVTLERRTALANEADADLFVSIHLNDSDVARTRGGITTFVLDSTDDAQALRLAARENGLAREQVTGLTRLLADLHVREKAAASRVLAERIHAGVLASARRVLPGITDRGVRPAPFYVLAFARMPAVLVEASFLSDPAELRALRTAAYRQALGEGIAAGIVAYVGGE